MSVTIYHNPACSVSRNTLAMIRQSGEEPEIIEYLKAPLDRAGLVELVKVVTLVVVVVVVVMVSRESRHRRGHGAPWRRSPGPLGLSAPCRRWIDPFPEEKPRLRRFRRRSRQATGTVGPAHGRTRPGREEQSGRSRRCRDGLPACLGLHLPRLVLARGCGSGCEEARRGSERRLLHGETRDGTALLLAHPAAC